MGEIGPHWAPHGAPMGAPISKRWGNFPPWGPQWQMMGGSNMPMGEINGHPDELCTMLSYKTSGPIVFPHGVKRYTNTVLFCVWMYNSITYRECRCFEGRATFNFWCQPAAISVHWCKLSTLPNSICSIFINIHYVNIFQGSVKIWHRCWHYHLNFYVTVFRRLHHCGHHKYSFRVYYRTSIRILFSLRSPSKHRRFIFYFASHYCRKAITRMYCPIPLLLK